MIPGKLIPNLVTNISNLPNLVIVSTKDSKYKFSVSGLSMALFSGSVDGKVYIEIDNLPLGYLMNVLQILILGDWYSAVCLVKNFYNILMINETVNLEDDLRYIVKSIEQIVDGKINLHGNQVMSDFCKNFPMKISPLNNFIPSNACLDVNKLQWYINHSKKKD